MDDERDDPRHVVPSGAQYTRDPKNDPKLSSAAAYNENFHAVFKQLSKTVGKEKTCLCDTKLPPDSGINLSRSIESLESNSPLHYIGKSVTEEKAVCFTDSDSMVDQPVKNQQEVFGTFSASLPSPDILEFDHTTGSGKCVCQLVVEESGPVNERYECPAAVQCRTESLSNTKEKTEEPLIYEDFKDLESQSSTQNQTKSAKNLEMSAESPKRQNLSSKRKRVSERQQMSSNGSFLNGKTVTFKIIRGGTTRGYDILEASDGHRYTRKRTSKKGIVVWRCRFRGKKTECPAIVKQCGEEFQKAGGNHIHEPTRSSGCDSSVKKRRKVEFRKPDDRSFLNDKTVTHKIIKWGTAHGGDILEASNGHQYIRKRTPKKGTVVRPCRFRGKKTECPAVVKQCGEQFQEAGGDNIHEPTSSSGCDSSIKKRRKVELREFRKPDDRSFINEKTVKWEIIYGATARGGDVLYAPDGHQYTRKWTSKNGPESWRCRVRNKESGNKECPAIVKQYGKKFVVAGKGHTH